MGAEFIAFFEKKLHSEAYAQKRLAFFRFLHNYGSQTAFLKLPCGVLEGAYARENDFIAFADCIGVPCNNNIFADEAE